MIVVVIPTMPERGPELFKLRSALARRAPWGRVVVSRHEDSRVDVANALELGYRARDPHSNGWQMYLEDDVTLGEDFSSIPDYLAEDVVTDEIGLVSFFALWDDTPGWHRVTPSGFSSTCCCVMRTDMIDGFREFAEAWYADRKNERHVHASDLLMGAWAREKERKILYRFPSLVQHLDRPSTFKGRSKARMSPSYQG